MNGLVVDSVVVEVDWIVVLVNGLVVDVEVVEDN